MWLLILMMFVQVDEETLILKKMKVHSSYKEESKCESISKHINEQELTYRNTAILSGCVQLDESVEKHL